MGVAASALPWAVSATGGEREALVDAVPLYKVVYDTRFAAAAEFARRASARGLTVHAMQGDMTRFWYDDLYHRWRSGPAAIAGLTARGALFCLEQLAWDQRMRVVFRAEHSVAEECVAHRFEGPAALVRAAVEAASSPAWSAAIADVIVRCPRGRLERATANATTTAVSTAPLAEPLFSWVIAPVIRA
jgi:hypothetical protein